MSGISRWEVAIKGIDRQAIVIKGNDLELVGQNFKLIR